MNRFLGWTASSRLSGVKGRHQHWSAFATGKILVDFVDEFFGESLASKANSSMAPPAPG
jgi:hypothetical protein